MNTRRLPQTDSIQELANFWDTHEVTDFADELEEVREPVFQRQTGITIHLQSTEASTVHELALSRGIDESELIRQWVVERLQTQ